MDEADIELLKLLFTHIGMEMVESGDEALRLGGPRAQLAPEKIAELDRSISRVIAMLHTAKAILK